MSMLPVLTKMLIQEHLFRPIKGELLVLGRQVIKMSKEEVLGLFSAAGCKAVNTEEDSSADGVLSKGKISDAYFFNLFGIESLSTMDVNDKEEASLIHDLNKPVPGSLKGRFDFIIDGGTFDHLFDVRRAFRNVVSMLKPDGRVFHWNAMSNYMFEAYLCFSPDFFYDYYVANRFEDCKVYVAEAMHKRGLRWRLWEFMGNTVGCRFSSSNKVMVIVLAERGPDSTSDRMSIQLQYRVGADQRLGFSKRNLLKHQSGPKIPGFEYVGEL